MAGTTAAIGHRSDLMLLGGSTMATCLQSRSIAVQPITEQDGGSESSRARSSPLLHESVGVGLKEITVTDRVTRRGVKILEVVGERGELVRAPGPDGLQVRQLVDQAAGADDGNQEG